jgi:hypothetical protein
VIIWINGPFGVGKTSVARELGTRWPASILFDPEWVGMLLRLIVPKDAHVDFQTLPFWRESVVHAALSLDRHYDGPVIVPMTLWRTDYFDEIVGGLRSAGARVAHFTVMASRATLLERISGTEEGKGWRLEHVDQCLDSLAAKRFAEHIPTDHRSIVEVADAITARLRDAG